MEVMWGPQSAELTAMAQSVTNPLLSMLPEFNFPSKDTKQTRFVLSEHLCLRDFLEVEFPSVLITAATVLILRLRPVSAPAEHFRLLHTLRTPSEL